MLIILEDLCCGGLVKVEEKFFNGECGVNCVIIVNVVVDLDMNVFVVGFLVVEQKGYCFIYCIVVVFVFLRFGI